MNERIENRLKDLAKALDFEKNQEISEYSDAIANKSIQERVQLGKTIYPLEYLGVKFSKFGDVLHEFGVNDNQSLSTFTAGASVQVFNAEDKSAKGVIQYVAHSKISVAINYSESNDDRLEDWIGKGKVGLNVLPDPKTYNVYLYGLKSFEDVGVPHQINYLYNKERFVLNSSFNFELPQLNNSQNAAVNEILEIENPVTIVHGPPGTGKTTTLVSAIEILVKQNKKVLICASTNAAVDNVCQQLVQKKLKTCRIGNPVKIDSELQDITLDGQAQNDTSFKLVEQLKK